MSNQLFNQDVDGVNVDVVVTAGGAIQISVDNHKNNPYQFYMSLFMRKDSDVIEVGIPTETRGKRKVDAKLHNTALLALNKHMNKKANFNKFVKSYTTILEEAVEENLRASEVAVNSFLRGVALINAGNCLQKLSKIGK